MYDSLNNDSIHPAHFNNVNKYNHLFEVKKNTSKMYYKTKSHINCKMPDSN